MGRNEVNRLREELKYIESLDTSGINYERRLQIELWWLDVHMELAILASELLKKQESGS